MIKDLCVERKTSRLEECEELLKHATDLVDQMDESEDTKWVQAATDKYFTKNNEGEKVVTAKLKTLDVVENASGASVLRILFENVEVEDTAELVIEAIQEGVCRCWAQAFRKGLKPIEVSKTFREIADSIDSFYEKQEKGSL